MGFFTLRCPNCGKSVSKDAPHCNACGCPTAASWATCERCGTSVGAGSKFCWKCGTAQDLAKRDRFYGDRWRRVPGDFAVRIELRVPGQVLHQGLQIDEGALALVFQDGKLKGTLAPGHHTIEGFVSRLLGFNQNAAAHAILLDTRSAEVDLTLKDLRFKGELPVDVRLRLLLQVADARLFVAQVVRENENFTTVALVRELLADVREVTQAMLSTRTLDDLFAGSSARDLLETGLLTGLQPALASRGLKIEGVRLAEFGGPAYEGLCHKLGEIDRLNRELAVNRRLQDALRAEKIVAYRDEQQLKDAFDAITRESDLSAAERDEHRKRFVQAAEHRTQLAGLRLDYEQRRTDMLQRLEEQKLRHQTELTDAMHGIELSQTQLAGDLRQQRERFGLGQEQQVVQSKTDLEIARQGIEALKLVKQAKLEAREKDEALELRLETERLKLRGAASMQGLLATLTGEQADRLLKLAELEMRQGLSVEQALMLAVEKSPEIAPTLAEAMKAKYQAANIPPRAG